MRAMHAHHVHPMARTTSNGVGADGAVADCMHACLVARACKHGYGRLGAADRKGAWCCAPSVDTSLPTPHAAACVQRCCSPKTVLLDSGARKLALTRFCQTRSAGATCEACARGALAFAMPRAASAAIVAIAGWGSHGSRLSTAVSPAHMQAAVRTQRCIPLPPPSASTPWQHPRLGSRHTARGRVV